MVGQFNEDFVKPKQKKIKISKWIKKIKMEVSWNIKAKMAYKVEDSDLVNRTYEKFEEVDNNLEDISSHSVYF